MQSGEKPQELQQPADPKPIRASVSLFDDHDDQIGANPVSQHLDKSSLFSGPGEGLACVRRNLFGQADSNLFALPSRDFDGLASIQPNLFASFSREGLVCNLFGCDEVVPVESDSNLFDRPGKALDSVQPTKSHV